MDKQAIYDEYRERYISGEGGAMVHIAREHGVTTVTIGQIIGEMRPEHPRGGRFVHFTEEEEFARRIARMRVPIERLSEDSDYFSFQIAMMT